MLRPPVSSGVVLRSSAKRYPADGQAIPPLRTSYYSLPSVGQPAPEPVKFPTPLRLRLHCRVFNISGSFQSGASPSYITSVGSARHGQHTRVIGRGLYVEILTAGTHEVHGRTQGKFSLLSCFLPPDSWDPPAISSHGRKCFLVMQKKPFLPMTAGTRQILWLSCGPTKQTCTHGFVNLVNK